MSAIQKVKWGILGVANIAVKKVIPAMQLGEWSEITAISSRDPAKAQSAAVQLNIPKAYGSYDELLADREIEAVYNPLPNNLHVEWTIKAAQSGKHVLCEKPIGMTVAEASRLLQVRRETGVKIEEAFMVRTNLQWVETLGMIREGRIGQVRSVAGFFSYNNHDLKNIRNIRETGGGGLMDIGCYMVHLCGRPLRNRGRCTLGRETAIQKMKWTDDGWLVTDDGEAVPRTEVNAPYLSAHEFPAERVRHDFNDTTLPIDFQWLRSPWPDELFSLSARPGHLRLYGRESIGSLFRQSLVARRQQSHCYTATTLVQFNPEDFQQMAGLICYYNAAKFHYFYISYDDTVGKYLRVMSSLPDQVQSDAFTAPAPITSNGPVELRVDVDFERLRFAFRTDKQPWTWVPEVFDASILSDEATAPGQPNFTGAFVGMCCQDSSGQGRAADFDYFEYIERDFQPHIEEL